MRFAYFTYPDLQDRRAGARALAVLIVGKSVCWESRVIKRMAGSGAKRSFTRKQRFAIDR
jgi:hypothetical protein